MKDLTNIKESLKITNMIDSIMNNYLHRNVFLAINLLILLFIMMILIKPINSSKTELVKITHNISVPKPNGQGQFGQNWWLDKKEYEKNFGVNVLEVKNPTIQKLLKGEEVQDNEVKHFKKGGLVIGYEKTKNKEKIYCITDNTHTLTLRCYKKWKADEHKFYKL